MPDHQTQTASSREASLSSRRSANPRLDPAASASGDGGPARRTNLGFGYKDAVLRGQNLQPKEIQQALLDTLHAKENEETKDGVFLTDTEKLYVVVEALIKAGYTDGALAGAVQRIFFEAGGNSAADQVASVRKIGREVHIEFAPGWESAPGAVLPMIASAPTVYPGLDTNMRGAQVDLLQGAYKPPPGAPSGLDALPRDGTFLIRQQSAVTALFLNSPQGSRFKLNPSVYPPSSSAYKEAYRAFEVYLMYEYLSKGTFHVKTQLAASVKSGRPAAALLQEALDCAMDWTNSYFAAAKHGQIELQDEAIAQRALQELGHKGMDIDTDAEILRRGP